MKRFQLLLVLAFGCTVDSTGLLPLDDAGVTDGALTDTEGPDARSTDGGADASTDGGPDAMVGECSAGMSRDCDDIGACQNRRQECVDGSWGECVETVFPETAETCDSGNVDEDCDGMSNEGCACTNGTTVPCGESDTLPCMMGVQRCVGGVLSEECEGAVLPMTETCNGVDDDCDSSTDEGELITFYTDNDGDTVGTTPTTLECELTDGYAERGGDCDDDDMDNYPGNTEVCDGQDNDCDELTDEGLGMTYYLDDDGDSYGDPAVTMSSCADPGGNFVTVAGDCRDDSSAIHPGVGEVCDLIDNNCSGTPDDGEVCRSNCEAHTYEGRVYQFCADNRNWSSAQNRCDDMSGNNSGLYVLVTINDLDENSFVNTTARSISTNAWWIGLTDSGNEGNYRWASGSDASYTLWGGGEPNDASNNRTEDCVEMRGDGAWNDARCWLTQYYVCEQAD